MVQVFRREVWRDVSERRVTVTANSDQPEEIATDPLNKVAPIQVSVCRISKYQRAPDLKE
jgi:hypothetical protein